jgi:hypothetical protein
VSNTSIAVSFVEWQALVAVSVTKARRGRRFERFCENRGHEAEFYSGGFADLRRIYSYAGAICRDPYLNSREVTNAKD